MLIPRGVKLCLIVLSILMFAAAYSMAGNIPQVINYSGTLTNTDGTPANGNYNMEFKIYNAASGGVALWTEKWDATTSQVTVVNGGFNVMLGNFSPIPMSFFEANFDADHPAVLGIKVGTDSEMMPRQQITSVGYAFHAGDGIPKGGIIMWSGSFAQIPYGWGLCDGLQKTAPDGTKVTPPDLQNRFIVGAGSAYAVGQTGGEQSHILTLSELAQHNHTGGTGAQSDNHTHSGSTDTDYPDHSHNIPAEGGQNDSNGPYARFDSGYSGVVTSHGANARHTHSFVSNVNSVAHNHTVANAGSNSPHENRPPYYALAFIMKL